MEMLTVVVLMEQGLSSGEDRRVLVLLFLLFCVIWIFQTWFPQIGFVLHQQDLSKQ